MQFVDKEKNSSAEVDYLIQRGERILPIEVKSGHGSTLRSLHLFLETHPQSTTAICDSRAGFKAPLCRSFSGS